MLTKKAQLVGQNLIFLALLLFLAACSSPTPAPAVSPDPLAVPPTPVELASFLETAGAYDYLDQTALNPAEATYFDLVNGTLNLNPAEVEMLAQNGFVVSDRLAYEDFTMAYAYLFWKDLPVLITTDSILQVIHQNYEDMLMAVEGGMITPRLLVFLEATRAQVRQDAAANEDKALDDLYEDVELYLTVPLALLAQGQRPPLPAPEGTRGVDRYLDPIEAAADYKEINLFGGAPRTIDYTLFKPRGHYAEYSLLESYFQAMTWLAQVDFRLLAYDPLTSEAALNPEHIAAAMILQQAIDRAGQRQNLAEIDTLFTALVGRSDNTVLSDLEQFLADAGLSDPAQPLAEGAAGPLLELLTANDYGQQRITGQIIYRHIANDSPTPIPRPVSFMLLGQRFALDAYVLGNVVYDRLVVEGEPVERPLPSPLDAMYALGNDRAAAHLTEELDDYGYQGNLTALRNVVDGVPPDFWNDSVYNRWLDIIRTLNSQTTTEAYPQVMRTTAWADKMLHTQLAGWTQLRHDNILYVKQSVTTAQVLCEYPAGYVEPYPEFFVAVGDYARAGQSLFSALGAPAGEYEEMMRQELLTYFQNLAVVADRLAIMADKELRGEPFNEEETLFFKSIIRRPEELMLGCGGDPAYESQWDGWYADLFLFEDDSPALVADLHTNPTNDPRSRLFPPRVLHGATGSVATALFIVDSDEGQTLYVGPVFTYYEFVETGDENTPPQRLNDQEWLERLAQMSVLPPAWTGSFRLPGAPEFLSVPLVSLSVLQEEAGHDTK